MIICHNNFCYFGGIKCSGEEALKHARVLRLRPEATVAKAATHHESRVFEDVHGVIMSECVSE